MVMMEERTNEEKNVTMNTRDERESELITPQHARTHATRIYATLISRDIHKFF